MKWLLLIFLTAIFTVTKYQGVTGFPRNVPDHTEWHREEIDTLLEDINTEVEDSIKSHLNSRHARGIGFFQFPVPTFNESLDYFSLRLKILKNSYDQTRTNLENIIKRFGLENKKNNVTRKDKDTKDQSTFKTIASGDEMQVNAAQISCIMDESVADQQPRKSCRLINPFKDVPIHVINYLNAKMEYLKLTYEEMMRNFDDIIDYIKNRVTKNKDIKDELEVTASGNKTQVNVTEATSTPNESVINQQSTSNENDKKDKFENHKETIENSEKGDKHTENNVAKDKDTKDQSIENTTSDNAAEAISTQDESIVNPSISGQFTPSKNDDEEEKSGDNKESEIPESTASSNETQEHATQTYFTPNESEQNENPENVDIALFL